MCIFYFLAIFFFEKLSHILRVKKKKNKRKISYSTENYWSSMLSLSLESDHYVVNGLGQAAGHPRKLLRTTDVTLRKDANMTDDTAKSKI